MPSISAHQGVWTPPLFRSTLFENPTKFCQGEKVRTWTIIACLQIHLPLSTFSRDSPGLKYTKCVGGGPLLPRPFKLVSGEEKERRRKGREERERRKGGRPTKFKQSDAYDGI